MVSLGLMMIVKDEEKNLERVLDLIKDLVDEIIIIDTGSKDNTKIIANRFGAQIFDFKWDDDFSKARNFGIDNSNSDWILTLDADELIDSKNLKHIRQFIKSKEIDCYSFPIKNFTDNKTQYGFIKQKTKTLFGNESEGFIINSAIRLFRSTPNIRYIGPVHEYIDTSKIKGKIGKTDLIIQHELKTSDILLKKQLKYLKIYEDNIDSYPNKARAYQDLGILYMNFKKDFKISAEYFKKSLKINEKNTKSWFGYGIVCLQLKDFENAWKSFSNAWQLDPTNLKTLVLLGIAAENDGNYKMAIDANKRLIEAGFPDKEKLQKKIIALKKQIAEDNNYQINLSYG